MPLRLTIDKRHGRGSAPIARRKGYPQSSALRLCRPPLRFALSVPAFRFLFKGGETLPLAPCYPRLRQVAFGMYMPRFNADVQRPTPKEEAPMNTTASTVTPISENPKCFWQLALGSSAYLVKLYLGLVCLVCSRFYAAWRTRKRRRSKLARPYMDRLISFRRCTFPSTMPLLHSY